MENKNITELVWESINEIEAKKDNYDPAYLSEKLVDLSALYANLTQHIADLESQYFKVLNMAMEKDDKISAARAKVMANAGDEYLKFRKAQMLEKSLIEEIRSIKIYIKIRQNEFQGASNL